VLAYREYTCCPSRTHYPDSEVIFALFPQCCVLSGEATNTSLDIPYQGSNPRSLSLKTRTFINISRCGHSMSVIFMTTLVSHQSKSWILLNKGLPSTDENMHNEYSWMHSKYYKLTIQYKVFDSTISNNLFISRIL
jgi:hypothetical protein